MSDNDDTRQEKQMDPKTRRLIGNARMVAETPADKLSELIEKLKAHQPRTEDN
ncbi:MAG: hypothetical protein HYT42_01430 [Candidatus Sungbacteria bacterium]|nr:hypothetical protein [Candidatus Sungbacteria bacterium]